MLWCKERGFEEMKHIVLFSGGAASSYCAYLVLQKEKKEDVILLHTPTHSEHETADIFRTEVANYLKHPITIQDYGMDLWQLIEHKKHIPSQFMPFCTQVLKMQQTEKFIKTLNGEDFIQYIGYSVGEWRRVQKTFARNEATGRKVSFPVFDSGINDVEIKRIITEEWKIELPEPYKHLKHNNCIPCFKAGMKEWRNYWLYYPDKFQKAVEYEKKIGYTVFKNLSLPELVKKWEDEREWEKMQVSMFEMMDNIPCTCAI